MTLTLIDYGSGNLHSAEKPFQHAADKTGQEVLVTSDPDMLRQASHIVLPGVVAYADCMNGLRAVDGMVEALHECVIDKGTYFFGICVGMQMMLTRGLEHGEQAGLNWIAGDVVPIEPSDPSLKIPHMGWNELELLQSDHPIFNGIQNGDHVYFVHSYHAQCADERAVLAQVDYGMPICACIGKDNMVGTQFHPEKSHHVGLQLIENFVRQ